MFEEHSLFLAKEQVKVAEDLQKATIANMHEKTSFWHRLRLYGP
jgi:hypothetical protein